MSFGRLVAVNNISFKSGRRGSTIGASIAKRAVQGAILGIAEARPVHVLSVFFVRALKVADMGDIVLHVRLAVLRVYPLGCCDVARPLLDLYNGQGGHLFF